jgi:hypothetical protein
MREVVALIPENVPVTVHCPDISEVYELCDQEPLAPELMVHVVWLVTSHSLPYESEAVAA